MQEFVITIEGVTYLGVHSVNKARVVQNAGMDSLDDFGVDLYAIPEPVASKIDLDENTRIAAMLNTTATEWQRYVFSILEFSFLLYRCFL